VANSYLWAVQNNEGRELMVWRGAAKVSDVRVVRENGQIRLMNGDEVVAYEPDDGAEYTLHRWPIEDKLAEPVSTPVPSPAPTT
jgi:hypothetical protein